MTVKPPYKNHVPIDQPAKIWLVGHVFTISNVFGDKPVWINQRHRLSIRPGETGADAYLRETSQPLPDRATVFEIDQ